MPTYRYLAKEESGSIVQGTLEAQDRTSLLSILRSRGQRLLKIETEIQVRLDFWQSVNQAHPFHFTPPTKGQVELLMEQLAVLTRSGMSLLTALRTIAEQARFRPLKRVVEDLSRRIQTGHTFAEAVGRHSCFPELIVQLIQVGEQTGELDLVCTEAARQLARQRENRSKLISAVSYPLFVALAATCVASFVVFYVIPKLRDFLSGLGRELPPMTQRLMDFATWMQTNGMYVAVCIVMAIALIFITYRTQQGRLWMDRLLLRVPLVGGVLRLSGTVTFASSLAVLTRSGVTVLDALQTVERLQGNRHLRLCVNKIRRSILEGGDISGTLRGQQGFSPLLAGMTRVGEETGQLDEVLEHVAHFHDQQLEKLIRRLGAMLEPTMIIVVGAMVAYVYMAFFVAIYNVGGSFR